MPVLDPFRYYVYEIVDPRDGRVFYVGKGCGHRDRSTICPKQWNPAKVWMLACIRDAGLKPIVQRIASGLSERQALRIERETIGWYGVSNLTNHVYPGSKEVRLIAQNLELFRNLIVPPKDSPRYRTYLDIVENIYDNIQLVRAIYASA